MKNDQRPTRAEDIEPYNRDGTVVRLFDGKSEYAGIIYLVGLDEEGDGRALSIVARRAIRFGHSEPETPLTSDDTLITEKDCPIKDSLQEDVRFRIEDPTCSSDDADGIRRIGSKKDGSVSAILSLRGKDRVAVEKLLACKPNPRYQSSLRSGDDSSPPSDEPSP